MMLAQIERKLADFKKEVEMQNKDATNTKTNRGLASPDRVPGSKVVAIDVDPDTYAMLQDVAKKLGVRGVRAALVLAAKSGLRQLLGRT